MDAELIIFIFLLVVAAWFSRAKRKLTTAAIITAAIMATILFIASGLKGVALMGVFFVLGVAATWWNRNKRSFRKHDEEEQRDALQVVANGGIATLLSLLILVFPDFEMVLLLMMASAFSSAAADTVSSELGLIYGGKTYNITSMQPDAKGENGVISLEGSLLGIAASTVIAGVYFALFDSSVTAFIVIIIAGTAGNFADSLLGATLERRNIIGNNAVNLLNTFIAAAIGGALIF